MSFTSTLRTRTSPTWTAAVSHRFVADLWAGAVPPKVMYTYLSQDFQFVDAFVALMGAAVSHSDSPSARMSIARQLGLVATDEDGYFQRALARLAPGTGSGSVPIASTSTSAAESAATSTAPAPAPTPLPPTLAFLDLMHAARTDYPSALTVLLVAEWLYLDWATPADPKPTPNDWVHAEWIELHRGPAFEAWVTLLVSETDRIAAAADPATRARMEEMFVRAVELELAFFDAAYGA